ncbi:MAG TPA: hypothetical protein VF169_00135 [Albitalea sp.]
MAASMPKATVNFLRTVMFFKFIGTTPDSGNDAQIGISWRCRRPILRLERQAGANPLEACWLPDLPREPTCESGICKA